MAIDCKKYRLKWDNGPEGGGSTMDDRCFSLRRSQVKSGGKVGVFHFCMSLHHPNNCFEKICFNLPLLNSTAPQNYSQDENNIEGAFSPLASPKLCVGKKHMYTICEHYQIL
jgi:hypothetical protein